MQVVGAHVRDAKPARTRVRLRTRHAQRALLELSCDTGRTHQLRVQLAHEGAPIAGDRAVRRRAGAALAAARRGPRARASERRPAAVACSAAAARVCATGSSTVRATRPAIRVAAPRARAGDGGALSPRPRARRCTNRRRRFGCFDRAADGAAELAVDVYGDHLVAHAFGGAIEAREADVLDALRELGFAGMYLKRHLKQKNELVDPRDDALRAGRAAARLRQHPRARDPRARRAVRSAAQRRPAHGAVPRSARQPQARARARAGQTRAQPVRVYERLLGRGARGRRARGRVRRCLGAAALAWGRRNVERIGAERATAPGTAMRSPRWHSSRRKREQFDLIILDPPSYSNDARATFRGHQGLRSAVRRRALHVLAPGGQLLACINHHGVSRGKAAPRRTQRRRSCAACAMRSSRICRASSTSRRQHRRRAAQQEPARELRLEVAIAYPACCRRSGEACRWGLQSGFCLCII